MSNDSAALLELEKCRLKAMNESDPVALLELLGDDHVHVMANGFVTDKGGVAASLRSIPRVVEPREPMIRIYGDTAVMTGSQVNHEQINGESRTIKLFVTQVARRIDGRWKFVSMQATRIPD
jgi:Domain of unknown function (DUF4440)